QTVCIGLRTLVAMGLRERRRRGRCRRSGRSAIRGLSRMVIFGSGWRTSSSRSIDVMVAKFGEVGRWGTGQHRGKPSNLGFLGEQELGIPNCSFVMYEGDGGVTFLEPRSFDLPRANMATASEESVELRGQIALTPRRRFGACNAGLGKGASRR